MKSSSPWITPECRIITCQIQAFSSIVGWLVLPTGVKNVLRGTRLQFAIWRGSSSQAKRCRASYSGKVRARDQLQCARSSLMEAVEINWLKALKRLQIWCSFRTACWSRGLQRGDWKTTHRSHPIPFCPPLHPLAKTTFGLQTHLCHNPGRSRKNIQGCSDNGALFRLINSLSW